MTDVLFFLDLAGDEHRNRRRDKGHRQQHRAEQGDHHSKRHRVEHFPFDAGEGKDRQVHDHDDQLAENQRSPRFLGRRKHFVKAFGAGERCVRGVAAHGPDGGWRFRQSPPRRRR